MVGCADEPAPIDTQTLGDELIDGTPTYERPEIGRISGCTATLVAPRGVITAAHCVNYGSRLNAGYYDDFTIDRDGQTERSFRVQRIRSFSTQLGGEDVAIMELAEEVPPEIATPTTVATQDPAQGEPVTLFGYGCVDRYRQSGTWTKRKIEYDYGDTYNLCPGDSGGPGVIGKNGPVFLINSGYYTNSGLDIFGHPSRLRDEITSQFSQWGIQIADPDSLGDLDGGAGNGGGGDNGNIGSGSVRVTNRTGGGLWVACNGQASATCSDWAFLRDGEGTQVKTPNRGLIFDNQNYLPSTPIRRLRATAPSEDVSVYANLADPFAPLAGNGGGGNGNNPPAGQVVTLRVTNQTGAGLWVACDGRASSSCTGWTFLRDGQSGDLTTKDRKLMLDNQNFLPSAPMSRLAAVAPSGSSVTVYPNPANPFQAPQGFEPGPQSGNVQVTNRTGASLWVACNGRASSSCTGWTFLRDGQSANVTTRNRKLMLDNQNFLPSAPMSRLAVIAPSDLVEIHPNPSAPFQAR
jgi:hypothetical protein